MPGRAAPLRSPNVTRFLTPSRPAHVHSWLAGKVTSSTLDQGQHRLGDTQMMWLGLQIRIQPEKVSVWPNLPGTLGASPGSPAMQLAGPDIAGCQRSKKLGLWLSREGSEALD